MPILHAAGTTQLTRLHCVNEYPAPYEAINLRAMQRLNHSSSSRWRH